MPIFEENGQMKWLPLSKYKDIFGENAYPLSRARRKLGELEDVVFMHLFKYFYYPNNQSLNHWRKELEAWRKTLAAYGYIPGNKKSNYSHKELMDAFFDSPVETHGDVELVIDRLVDKEYSEIDINEAWAQIGDFKKFVESYVAAILDKTLTPNY